MHEVAIAAREATIKRIDDAHDDLVELSRRERDLEGVNDPSFQQWSESVNQRLDAAFAEICAVIKEAKTKSQEQGLARAGAAGLASAIGLTTYTAPQIEHDRRMGVLRRAAHAAIERAGLYWHGDVKDLIVGY